MPVPRSWRGRPARGPSPQGTPGDVGGGRGKEWRNDAVLALTRILTPLRPLRQSDWSILPSVSRGSRSPRGAATGGRRLRASEPPIGRGAGRWRDGLGLALGTGAAVRGGGGAGRGAENGERGGGGPGRAGPGGAAMGPGRTAGRERPGPRSDRMVTADPAVRAGGRVALGHLHVRLPRAGHRRARRGLGAVQVRGGPGSAVRRLSAQCGGRTHPLPRFAPPIPAGASSASSPTWRPNEERPR